MAETDVTATLEVLYRARASLACGPFSYHDWTCCTCGHLYAAANGGAAERRADVRTPAEDTPYAAAVIAIARALAPDARRFATTGRHWWDRRSPAALAARWVSDRTMRRALREQTTVARADAIAVIDAAIAALAPVEQPPDVHERRLPA